MHRFPVTGVETVLEVFSQVESVPRLSDKKIGSPDPLLVVLRLRKYFRLIGTR